MIHHLVTGVAAASAIEAAVAATPTMAGEVWTLEEQLQAGPLARGMNQSFDDTRAAWWRSVLSADKEPPAGAQAALLQISNALNKQPQAMARIWMAPHPADVTAYYFALSQLEKHRGRVQLIQIAGLPFLDEQQKVFFPKSFAGLSVRELAKCEKLVRPVTPSEWELDLDVWKELCQHSTQIRVAPGGKKLVAKEINFYDEALLELCNGAFQKAYRVVQHAINKLDIAMPPAFLASRLKALAASGALTLQGDPDKGLRDFDIKRAGTAAV